MNRTVRALVYLLVLLWLVALWEIASRDGWVDSRLLPPASQVFETLLDFAASPDFWDDVRATLAVALVSFLIAVPAGVLLGILIAENRLASAVLKPIVFFAFSIPKSVFLPVFILVFGIAFWEKVAFGIFSTIFVMMMAAFSAVESIHPEHLMVAWALRMKPMQRVLFVYLPDMTPVLLEAVRLAAILNFTGILLAEMYASRQGIGNVLGAWGQGFQIRELLAMIIFVSVVAIALNELIRYFETKCEHWRG
jgi:NitT/TauT family transport system permease protein